MTTETTPPTAPTLPMPNPEPVAHPDCRICFAADRGRTAARTQKATGGVATFNGIIADHPHCARDANQTT